MSSRKFTQVSPAMWRPGRFLSLSSVDAQLIYLYLLTGPHQNSAGCYRLPDGYAAADLGWELARYRKARDQLVEADFILFDEKTLEIYIQRWFQHCPPTGPKHTVSVERIISAIDSDAIREQAEADLTEIRMQANPIDTPTAEQAARAGLTRTPYFNGRGAR